VGVQSLQRENERLKELVAQLSLGIRIAKAATTEH
jgi:hypothetical protein